MSIPTEAQNGIRNPAPHATFWTSDYYGLKLTVTGVLGILISSLTVQLNLTLRGSAVSVVVNPVPVGGFPTPVLVFKAEK